MRDNDDHDVLLIFPSSFSPSTISTLQSIIKKTLEESNITLKDMHPDGSIIVAEVDDTLKAGSVVADLFGVERVAVAKEAGIRFDQLVDAIVDVGKKTVNYGNTFAVKVVSNRAEYVGRDVEFAATASLVAELSSLNVKPASEDLCSKLIHAYVSQGSAYVCIFIDKGLGGLPLGSQGEQVLCSLHNSLSALSCLMVIKCGLHPKIVLLNTDEESFRESARNLGLIAKRLGKKRMKLYLARVAIDSNSAKPFLIEKVSSMILARLASASGNRNLVLPLSAAVFPSWLISEIVSNTAKVAVPWTPLMLMSNEIYSVAASMGLRGSCITEDIAEIERLGKTLDAEKYAQLIKKHELQSIVDEAMITIQTVDLEIGPTYIHDIIDLVAT